MRLKQLIEIMKKKPEDKITGFYNNRCGLIIQNKTTAEIITYRREK